ncbi:Protoheme IX farnesyltransferase, mitochondrial [Labeo rohita]|uniref:Protoheme IX farnesyltransferase, mitochondrial n=1 Tax=Labeo rohita TaxID=84645 RepID=A0ABQ8MJY1_LABRO|nr:Protoheme IX farnesyltransferase, mitochondrial [Labeo rohita]
MQDDFQDTFKTRSVRMFFHSDSECFRADRDQTLQKSPHRFMLFLISKKQKITYLHFDVNICSSGHHVTEFSLSHGFLISPPAPLNVSRHV